MKERLFTQTKDFFFLNKSQSRVEVIKGAVEEQTSCEESCEVMLLENIVCSCLSLILKKKRSQPRRVLFASVEDLRIMLSLYEEILNMSSIPRANL